MKAVIFLLSFTLLATVAHGQTAMIGTPASNGLPCDASHSLQIVIQNDATNGRFWACDQFITPGTWAWDHFTIPILGVTASIGGSALLAGTCTTAQTVTVTNAVVGKNVLLTPSDGSLQQAGTIAQGSVSSSNTVSYQLCGTGLISITPTSKTYTIQVLP